MPRSMPQTTCHYGYQCDHQGRPPSRRYRFNVEFKEVAMSTTYPIEFRGEQSLSVVLKSLTLMGYGKGGEIWICLSCFEGVLDGSLYRRLFGDGTATDPTRLHPLIQWLNYIVPETRSVPAFPGAFTLNSPQRHTVYLWIAVHQRIVYLCENPNVKNLLKDGVYVEKAFPSDVFPGLNGAKTLYPDEATRDFRGYTSNGKIAELKWDQVLERKLSDSLAMSDELVEFLESEMVDVSPDQLGPREEGSHDSDSGSYEEDDEEEEDVEEEDVEEERQDEQDNGEEDRDEDEDGDEEDEADDGDDQHKRTQNGDPNNADTNSLLTAESRSISRNPTLAAAEAPPRGLKRKRDEGPGGDPGGSSTETTHGHIPTSDDQGTQARGREGEGARRKRAKLAWQGYLKSFHCS